MKAFLNFAVIAVIYAYSNTSEAQGLSNRWLMGYASGFSGFGGININFDSIPVIATHQNRSMNFDGACASICDKQGNLLFYSNGIAIANADNDTMLNGNNLSPGSFSNQHSYYGSPAWQSIIIIPDPGDSNQYYIFHQLIDWIPSQFAFEVATKLLFTKVNMLLDNGKGAVTQKNQPILSDTLVSSELTACKHANGRDWWVFSHKLNSDLFYKLLITPQGILGPFTQHIGDSLPNAHGQNVFSPNGKKYVRYQITDDVNILDFDRCSGNFSNSIHISINDSSSANGVAFSPNSKLIYVSSLLYVYQINTEDTSSFNTLDTVAIYDGFFSPQAPLATTFFLAQLASDGKIYINSTNGVLDLHVINNPDSLGASCNLAQHSLHLPAYYFRTMPNYPNYFLGADSGSVCDTLQLTLNKILPKSNLSIGVFPNPAIDWVYITYSPDEQIKQLEILNVNGDIVSKANIPQWSLIHQIDVTNLVNGIYLCRLRSKGKITSCKFVKTSTN